MQKRKILISVFVIMIAITASLGATLAWFTDSATAPENVFEAGTVEISAELDPVSIEDKTKNVNPGDCFVKCFSITNTGSKAIELRLNDFIGSWQLVDTSLNNPVGPYPNSPIFIAPQPYKNDSGEWVSDWVMKYDDTTNGFDFYYKGGPIPGTFNGATEEERTVRLCILVVFDGPEMDDKYQGATFELEGSFEAVQSSNDAPDQAWTDADWNTWRGSDGWFSMDYVDALRAGTTGLNLIPGFPYPASDPYNDYADYFEQNETDIICLTNGGDDSDAGTAYAGSIDRNSPTDSPWFRIFDTQHSEGLTQPIYEGNDSGNLVGNATVTAAADGKRTITVVFVNGWGFDPTEDKKLKVKGSNDEPDGRGAPGLYPFKGAEDSLTIEVDDFRYYLIHLVVSK